MTIFAIGVFMAGLDNGIMSSALTTLIRSFRVSANWGAWIVTIYTLGLAVSVPIMAKLSDRFGRKRMFLISIALFGLGSMSVALSQSFTILLISRVVQSLGGGGIFPIASGYIVSTVPTERQGRALGMVGGMNGISAIIGPDIGAGLLSITHDWHWLFWVNVPVAILLIVFGQRGIEKHPVSIRRRLDFGGIVLLSLGVLGFMYGLTNLKSANILTGLRAPDVYGYVAGGIVLLVALLLYEGRVDRSGGDSLVPMSLLRRVELRWTLAVGFVSGMLLSSVIFLPAYVQTILGWPSSQAGFWYTPMALLSGVGAMGGGRFMDRRGPITTLSFGIAVAAVGSLLFPVWVTTTWQMVIASSLIGLGVGVTLAAPLNFMITEHVPQNKSTALGILSLVREVGMTLGPALFAGFLTRAFGQFPTRLAQNLHAAGISASQIPASQLSRLQGIESFGNLTEEIRQIPNLTAQGAVLKAIKEVSTVGFNNLFWAALILSLVGLAFVWVAGRYRSRAMEARDLTRSGL